MWHVLQISAVCTDLSVWSASGLLCSPACHFRHTPNCVKVGCLCGRVRFRLHDAEVVVISVFLQLLFQWQLGCINPERSCLHFNGESSPISDCFFKVFFSFFFGRAFIECVWVKRAWVCLPELEWSN